VLAVGEPFIQNLDVIVAAMRPGAFLQHLLKSREMELLAEATRRLRAITNGRFGFVADFGVVNLASGEVRSPDSLSGGERFQAALALALALVEIASRGAGRLDAVFVDEGFGSLDASALDMALATLGSVAGGGKTVALISHLRPVAEYVETVLHVTRSDVVGSRIERLGPDARDQLLADDIRSGLTA
jgi:exonuclease SbcC